MITQIQSIDEATKDIRQDFYFTEDQVEYEDRYPRSHFFETRDEEIYRLISFGYIHSRLRYLTEDAVRKGLLDLGSHQAKEWFDLQKELDGLF